MGAKRNQPSRYWLMKSEPGTFAIDDLEREGTTAWDGVRNYQARNLMRDEMKVGDLVLFYHSSTDPVGVAGIARVCSAAYPDPTQFDRKSKYHDPDSDPADPRWYLVDIEFVEKFPSVIPLATLRKDERLHDMPLLRKGQRLSVQPVGAEHWQVLAKLRKQLE
jgi:predicted RNA-binding protein with PUA-like domain